MNKISPKAFTLTELIVSFVVVTIVSIFSWRALTVLNPTSEFTSNRVLAENLITKSLEQVYQAAQNQFDSLENCTFLLNNSCGFEDISGAFPGFNRTLSFISQNTSEFKGIKVSVSWTEKSVLKKIDSMVLLARPKENVPGNIVGKVINSQTNTILDGVTISVYKTKGPSEAAFTTSLATLIPRSDGLEINYTFADPTTSRFRLKPGTWRLIATKSGFITSVPVDVNIDSNQEQIVNINLNPVPPAAHIRGRVINSLTGEPISFGASSFIRLYENLTMINSQSSTGSYDITINFNNSNPRRFSLVTVNSFLSNWVGNISCVYPYSSNGWSSSVVTESGIDCSRNWYGGGAADRILVNPGDNITMDIPLVPMPLATLRGYVYNQDGHPVENAQISVSWYSGESYPVLPPAGRTNAAGYYELPIAAAQSIFPSNSYYFMRAYASIYGQFVACCNLPTTNQRFSSTLNIGPLIENGILDQNFVVNTQTQSQTCGNANGNVIDDSGSSSILGATIQLAGSSSTSSTGGFFEYVCSAEGYKLPTGTSHLSIQKDGYYNFHTAGNEYYNPSSMITISQNSTTQITPSIGIWPQGFGVVRGRILNADTAIPVTGKEIRLYLSGSTSNYQSVLTDNNGYFIFNIVRETWPPPALLNNGRYVQSQRNHHLVVVENNLYEQFIGSDFTLLNLETKDFNISLIPKGAV